VKIIHQGKIPEKAQHRMTCRHCKTVFEIARDEGVITHSPKNERIISYDCPTCMWRVGEDLDASEVKIHCPEKLRNGGVCNLHNLHCGYPKCEEA
jgi:RNase P subunit RPR2